MLNGRRHLWDTKEIYSAGKTTKVGSTWHKVCPSYKHLSAVTNNGFRGISWFMLVPTLLLIGVGVASVLFVTWILALPFFIAAFVPYIWLINRYFTSTAWKWEKGSEIGRAESAYNLMPVAKQKEYRHFIDYVFKGSLDATQAKKLFDSFSEVTSIQAKLDQELKLQKEKQKIIDELNESLGISNESA